MKATLSQWLNYLETLNPKRIALGLERVAAIATRLQLTQFSCPVITVAGTNGKGSVCKILESIYAAAGYRVACYTSPHLHRINERMRCAGAEIADDVLIEQLDAIEGVRNNLSLSFFEYTTLAALKWFQAQRPDVVILEVGLGGRLDAVNVVENDIAVITSIDLDHQAWLGDTREQIGYEKAGVIKPNRVCVCGDPNLPQSILKQAKRVNATLFRINHDFHFETSGEFWTWFGGGKQWTHLPKPALKLQNAATALMAIAALQAQLLVQEQACRLGLQQAELPGRLEIIQQGNTRWILDVAHNPQAMRWLVAQCEQRQLLSGSVAMVFAMLDDKAIEAAIEPLLNHIDDWFVTALSTSRAASIPRLEAALRAHSVKNWYNASSVESAYSQIKSMAHWQTILVCGSFHTVAEARTLLKGRTNNGC